MAKKQKIAEGNDKGVTLGGIINSTSEDICQDGSMEEIVNLRHHNGSLRPIGQFPYALFESDGVTPSNYINGLQQTYIHINNDYENWLGFDGSNVVWFASKNSSGTVCLLSAIVTLLTGVSDPQISSVKNIATVSWVSSGVNTAVNRMYLFFENGTYNVLDPTFLNPCFNFYLQGESRAIGWGELWQDESTNSMQDVTTDPYQKCCTATMTFGKTYALGDALNDDDQTIAWEAVQGVIAKGTSLLNQAGKITGAVLIRYAIQLFDGTYIKHSPVMLVNCQNNLQQPSSGLVWNAYYKPYAAPMLFWPYQNLGTNVSGFLCDTFALCYGYDLMMSYQKLIPPSWQDLIISVDIFMSSPIHIENYVDMPTTIYPGTNSSGSPVTFVNPIMYTPLQIQQKIQDTSTFYKIHSIDIADIIMQQPESPVPTTPVAIDLTTVLPILETQETMVDDNSSYIQYASKSVFQYNQKQHIGNVTQQYFNGYPLTYYQLVNNNYYYDPAQNYILNTFIEFTQMSPYTWSNQITGTIIAPLSDLSYMAICVKIKDQNDVWVVSKSTTPDQYSTLVGYMANIMSGLFTYPDSNAYSFQAFIATTNGFYYQTAALTLIPHTYLDMSIYVNTNLMPIGFIPVSSITLPTPQNTIEVRPNLLKVSVVDDPIVFTDAGTYQVGEGAIVGMCANTNPISLGQFGQYPLIVYSSDGRWALGVSTDTVDYSSIKPLSRDVCVNGKSITPLDNMIAFVSNQGLMIDTGSNECVCISKPLEGDGYDFTTGIDQLNLLTQAVNNAKLVQLSNQITKIRFLDYLANVLIGFSYRNDKEIIISNPSYAYSFIYNLDTKTFYKSDYQIKNFINDYPNLYACFNDGFTRSISGETYTGSRQTMLLTRPIKVQGEQWKEAYRSVLRSLIYPTSTSVGFYVFGSEDGIMWRFLGGTETDGQVKSLPKFSIQWTGHQCELVTTNGYNQAWSGYVCVQIDSFDYSMDYSNDYFIL